MTNRGPKAIQCDTEINSAQIVAQRKRQRQGVQQCDTVTNRGPKAIQRDTVTNRGPQAIQCDIVTNFGLKAIQFDTVTNRGPEANCGLRAKVGTWLEEPRP